MDPEELKRRTQLRPEAWNFFTQTLGSPKYFVAPMVDGSVLPFRLLCKRHGADLGVTPMIYSQIYASDPAWRKDAFTTCPEDTPFIAQICGHDPDSMVQTANLLEGVCAAVDVNLGCPQKVAKKGAYGVFFAEKPQLVAEVVRRLSTETKMPITCKMRLSPTIEESIAFAKMLEESGCKMLTVHGRKKDIASYFHAPYDWDSIARIVENVSIPVVANGGIKTLEDAQRCIQVTKAQAVMVGTGLLTNPALFSGVAVDPCDLAREFIQLSIEHPISIPIMRGILVKMLLEQIQKYKDLREELVTAVSPEEADACVQEIQRRAKEGLDGEDPYKVAAIPWDKSVESRLAFSLVPGDDLQLWFEAMAFTRAPQGKKRGPGSQVSGGWVIVMGIGKRNFPYAALKALRESVNARAWVLRHNAVYLDVPDDALYASIKETRHVKVYYKISPEEASNDGSGGEKDEKDEKGEEQPPHKQSKQESK